MDAIRPKVGPGPNDATARAVQTLADPTLLLAQPRANAAPPAAGAPPAFEPLHLDARGHLEHAVRADPAAVRPRLLLFTLELRDQDFAAAERIIVPLVREFPLEPDYLAHYADLELRRAALPQSRALVERALRIDPKHVEALRVKAVLDVVWAEQTATDPATPEQRLVTVIERELEAPKVLLTLFHTLVAHHHLPEALRLGNALLSVHPENAALRNALIDVRFAIQPLGDPLYALRRAGGLGFVIVSVVVVTVYGLSSLVHGTLAAAFLVVCLLVAACAWLLSKWLRR